MAELTNIESKLGEVTGLAMASQVAVSRVLKLVQDENADLARALKTMDAEAAETERRCTELAGTFEGKKTAILDEARATKRKGADMLKIYLDEDSDALDGFEFLTMAEAGEVSHWGVLRELNGHAAHGELSRLIEWALPIQDRHFQNVLGGTKSLAASEDPDETA